MTRLLYVTDLTYQARGRRYCDEDIALSDSLRNEFDVALCHPVDAGGLMEFFDVVFVRNTGPVIYYREAHDAFRRRAAAAGTRVFSELSGKADMAGKQYLLDLYAAGYPVIPTAASLTEALALPAADQYIAKPKLGADSVGLQLLGAAELSTLSFHDMLVQPRIDFVYEVSFYYVDDTLEYALYAPDPARRWDLTEYRPSAADRAFADRFIAWNDIVHGIQRVDACRTADGDLLLVEVEDLNPYLSLDVVDAATRSRFIADLSASLRALAHT